MCRGWWRRVEEGVGEDVLGMVEEGVGKHVLGMVEEGVGEDVLGMVEEYVGKHVLGMVHLQRFSDDLTSQPVWPHEDDDS